MAKTVKARAERLIPSDPPIKGREKYVQLLHCSSTRKAFAPLFHGLINRTWTPVPRDVATPTVGCFLRWKVVEIRTLTRSRTHRLRFWRLTDRGLAVRDWYHHYEAEKIAAASAGSFAKW